MSATDNLVLQLKRVTKQYEGAEVRERLEILKDLSLDVQRGTSLAIIGPSGSGKSTLLNILGTLDRPSSGQVLLDGRDLSQLNGDQLATVRSREIGFIFQSHHLLPQCSLLENVLVPALALSNRTTPEVEERARRLIARVGLGERMSHRPAQLSGGERQRAAVVRALINRPKLVLADEPTGALDRASALDLAELLLKLNSEEGVTLIVVTHALDLAKRMNHVYELTNGHLRPLQAHSPTNP